MIENLIGATTAVFPIRLSVAVTSPVDVEWATRDGSAVAGSDYKATAGTVTFLPGETEKQIEVQVYGQAITPADDKIFFIRLNPPSNAVLVDAILTCTINIIDDQGTPSVAVVIAEGRRGPKGDPGLSAYEQAVLMGYTGTLAEWMDQIADSSKAADRAGDYAISASEDALKAQNAAKNAVFAGVIFPTAAEGVDPVLGVQNGAYFNVRSPFSEHYIDEYQNVNGVAVATGKSYPTSDHFQNISEHTALPFVDGTSYKLNQRVVVANGDIVKSTIDGNTNDPNVDMTGWVFVDSDSQITTWSGRTQADKNKDILFDKDFGLLGDSSDETELLQTALNNSKVLYFTSGRTYKVSQPLYIADSLAKIEGNGAKFIYDREQSGVDNSLFNAKQRSAPLTIRDIELEYIGTFDHGNSYSGAVCGIDVGAASAFTGLLIEGVTASGFNRSGVQIASGGEYITRVTLRGCYLHHNRVAGVWFGNVDGVEVTGNRLDYNGLESDPLTGYGVAGISDSYPKNINIHHNTCNNNLRKGIDTHSGFNVTVDSNICHDNRIYGIAITNRNDHPLGGAVKDMGSIKITNNSVKILNTSGIDCIGISAGKYGTPETNDNSKTSILISGNSLDIKTSGSGVPPMGITLWAGGWKDYTALISNNQVTLDTAGYVFAINDSIDGDRFVGGRGSVQILANNIEYDSSPNSSILRLRGESNIKSLVVDNNRFLARNVSSSHSLMDFASMVPMPIGSYFRFSGNTVSAPNLTKFNNNIVYVHNMDNAEIVNNTLNGKRYRDYINSVYIDYRAAVPTEGTWYKGSVVNNIGSGVSDGFQGWVCTATGTPGTWVGFGTKQQSTAQVTMSELQSKASAVNTSGKFGGKLAYVPTTGKLYYSLGSSATNAWRPFDASGDITPS